MKHQLPPGPTLRVHLGVPLYIHWSVPAMGASFAMFPLMVGRDAAGLIGFVFMTCFIVLLVLIHELGHALAAMACGVNVTGIVLYFRGGLCFADAVPESRFGRALCICGGVLAQAVAFLAVAVAMWIYGPPKSYWLVCAAIVFLGFNPIFMLASVIPHRDNDGARLLEELRSSP
jgi:hypothetical protein